MKKIISLLLVVVLSIGMLGTVGCSKKEKEDYITRAEWAMLLGEQFGMKESDAPLGYFKDVSQTHEAYPYIQSLAEWGVLDVTSEEFAPDEAATREFAFETAFLAAGVDLSQCTAVEYAVSQGMIQEESYANVRGRVTNAFANELLMWSQDFYLYNFPTEKEKVVLHESVKDIREAEEEITAISEDSYIVSNQLEESMEIGDVVIMPATEENPMGVARKIVDIIQKPDGTIEVITEEPALEEICKELEIATVVVPEAEDFILPEGVTLNTVMSGESLVSKDEELNLQKALGVNEAVTARKTAEPVGRNFSFQINLNKGGLSLNTDFFAALESRENVKIGQKLSVNSGATETAKGFFEHSSVIPDKTLFSADPYTNTAAINSYKEGNMSLDELVAVLDSTDKEDKIDFPCITNKFSGGYEITGTIDLNNLYIHPEVEMGFFKLKKASVTINCDAVATLEVKGELREELVIASCPIPVGPSGVTVNIQIILFANANGELSVRAEVKNNVKVEYSGGKLRQSKTYSSDVTASVQANLDVGPAVGVAIKFYDVKIADAKLNCAVRFKADLKAELGTMYEMTDDSIIIRRQSTLMRQIRAYIPIIHLRFSIAGIEKSWELVGEGDAKKLDIYSDNGIIWEEVQTIERREESKEEKEDDFINNLNEYLSIDIYYISLEDGGQGAITVTKIPQGYSMEDIVWTSSNPEVVSVEGGIIRALSAGFAIISVQTKDGVYEAQCSVVVEDEAIIFTPLPDLGC